MSGALLFSFPWVMGWNERYQSWHHVSFSSPPGPISPCWTSGLASAKPRLCLSWSRRTGAPSSRKAKSSRLWKGLTMRALKRVNCATGVFCFFYVSEQTHRFVVLCVNVFSFHRIHRGMVMRVGKRGGSHTFISISVPAAMFSCKRPLKSYTGTGYYAGRLQNTDTQTTNLLISCEQLSPADYLLFVLLQVPYKQTVGTFS